jgi:anthraniloyl-CoA monooxygenase
VSDASAFSGADLILAADGVNSTIRTKYAQHFGPEIDFRPNRFVWLGTTFPFRTFTFYFKEDQHGLWRVHAYRYEQDRSTFIVECREETWRAAGMDRASEDETIAYLEKLFAEELGGHRLIKNRSLWRSFPVIRNAHWSHENIVLMGDAAHTAHFSIGSGTKLALEDSIALAEALQRSPNDVRAALQAYERERRPSVEALQKTAMVSLEWFEQTEHYAKLDPIQFTMSLLTRSLRVTHDNLRVRDPAFVERVDRWFSERAGAPSVRPPMFTPLRLRDLTLDNRVVVSPMCQYSAEDGTIADWHLVHLGSRAIGGAGLVIAEMTAVAPDARITPGCSGIYDPKHVQAWRRVTDFVHRETSAKIGLQLGHAGRKGSMQRPWDGGTPLSSGGWTVLGPTAAPFAPGRQIPKVMDRRDMDRVREEYARGARLADEAGFDLLEIHMAHGYLLASFLSPLSNPREDEYGGVVENRLRFPLEVFDAVRSAWPKHKPISVRISATDWTPRGLAIEDAVAIARALKAHGADILDVSGGGTVPESRPEMSRLYQVALSDRLRNEAEVPTMTVGGLASWDDANSVLAAGRADLCVIARGHLFDPYWTHHAASDQALELPWPKQYSTAASFRPYKKQG